MQSLRIGFLSLAAAALQATTAQADEERYLKTVCLWNDTNAPIDYELQWNSQFLRPSGGTLQPNWWYSHSLVLANANDPGLAVKIRFKEHSLADFGEWMAIEPLVTTSQNCSQLRGQNLHYEFKVNFSDGSYSLRGPTDDP